MELHKEADVLTTIEFERAQKSLTVDYRMAAARLNERHRIELEEFERHRAEQLIVLEAQRDVERSRIQQREVVRGIKKNAGRRENEYRSAVEPSPMTGARVAKSNLLPPLTPPNDPDFVINEERATKEMNRARLEKQRKRAEDLMARYKAPPEMPVIPVVPKRPKKKRPSVRSTPSESLPPSESVSASIEEQGERDGTSASLETGTVSDDQTLQSQQEAEEPQVVEPEVGLEIIVIPGEQPAVPVVLDDVVEDPPAPAPPPEPVLEFSEIVAIEQPSRPVVETRPLEIGPLIDIIVIADQESVKAPVIEESASGLVKETTTVEVSQTEGSPILPGEPESKVAAEPSSAPGEGVAEPPVIEAPESIPAPIPRSADAPPEESDAAPRIDDVIGEVLA
jgi:hypothetical protein